MIVQRALRLAALACLCAVTAGCLTPSKPPPQRVFRLDGCHAANPGAAAQGAETARGTDGAGRQGLVIRVEPVRAPGWLHDTGIVYRLDYTAGHRRASYAQARWAEPPTEMLTADLRSNLAETGPWSAVVGPDVNARADWTLTARIDELVHAFTSPDRSYASLQGSLLLVDGEGHILAQREVQHRVQAKGADAVAGVAAMSEAESAMCTDARTLLEQAYHNRRSNDPSQGIENRQ